jgi:aspartyl-tRNA(Asn)/glutamyl-tRNA(Gln) amidotransferase subunit A
VSVLFTSQKGNVMNPTDLTITEAAPLLRERKLSPVELTEAYLERIERLNPILNAYITVTAEQAMDAARTAEGEIMRGEYRGALHGIPVALKDNFETAGIRTTAGSSFLRDYVPTDDSAVAERLKQAGAILLGKTNMHEWAFGVINKNPFYGDTRNPWDTARITGGSSGGSAAAVSARLCAGAFGTDTRGSVRIPASICGVVGLKPTWRRFHLKGIVPLSFSLDHPGVLGSTVNDAALLFALVWREYAGYSENAKIFDMPFASDHYLQAVRDIRIAVAKDNFFQDTSSEILEITNAAVDVLRELGATIIDVDLGFLRETWLASRVISSCDAALYHSQRVERNPEGFGEDVLPRLHEGNSYTGKEYASARLNQIESAARVAEIMNEGFAGIVTPSLPITAPRLDDQAGISEARQRLSMFAAPFNMIGYPALSIPCGYSKENFPIGLQIVGGVSSEMNALMVAAAYEQATEWHKRQPPMLA